MIKILIRMVDYDCYLHRWDKIRSQIQTRSGRTWIKGRFKRTLVEVSGDRIKYSLVNKKERETSLDCFVNWVFSGAKLDVGKRIIPCSGCQRDLEIKQHINRCECGLRIKVLH